MTDMTDFCDLFPTLFTDEEGQFQPIVFECGPGWERVVYALLHKLSHHGRTTGQFIQITQVKEKWGLLTVYHYGGDEETDRIIDEFEEVSLDTCEICGTTGAKRLNKGWVKTLCNACQVQKD